jgi:hypothetical protein
MNVRSKQIEVNTSSTSHREFQRRKTKQRTKDQETINKIKHKRHPTNSLLATIVKTCT